MTAASATACFNVQAKNIFLWAQCVTFFLYTARIPYKVNKQLAATLGTLNLKCMILELK